MERRKFIIGAGSLAAGSAAAVGTGAFSSVQASRGIDVSLADDSNAFLQLTAPNSLENGEYASDADENGNQLTLEFDSDADVSGSGVNVDAMNRFDEVFEVTNMGTHTVNLFIKDSGLSKDQRERLRFYHGSNRKTLEDGGPDGDADGKKKVPVEVGTGESEAIGLEIDTTGIDSPQKLVDGGSITIYTED